MTDELMGQSLEAGAVLDVFRALNQARVRYVVLRGYLPQSELAESADIDIFVTRADFEQAREVLQRTGWRRRKLQFGVYPHVFFDYLNYRDRFVTAMDVVYGLNYGFESFELGNSAAVLDRSQLDGEIRVPHPWHALFLLVLHLSLDKAELLPHQYERLRRHWELCQQDADGGQVLIEDFGADANNFVRGFVNDILTNDSQELSKHRIEVRVLSCIRPQKLSAFARRAFMRIHKRFARPARIAVLGIDGAGKSTLIRSFEALGTGLAVGSAYLGYNDFQTTWFKTILARLNSLASSEATREGVELRILDAIRAVLFPFEIRARIRRAEWGRHLMLYDRYPFSFESTSGSSSLRARALNVIVRLTARVVPQADFVVFLDGDAQVLWARKREYPLDRFIEAQKEYRRAYEALPLQGVTIKTDDKSIDDATRLIGKALAESSAVMGRLYYK